MCTNYVCLFLTILIHRLRSEARIERFAIPSVVPIAHSYYMIIIKIKYSYPVKYINTKIHRYLLILICIISHRYFEMTLPVFEKGGGEGDSALRIEFSLASTDFIVFVARGISIIRICANVETQFAHNRTSDQMFD